MLLSLYFLYGLFTVKNYFYSLDKKRLFNLKNNNTFVHDIFVVSVYGWLILFFYIPYMKNIFFMEYVIAIDQVSRHLFRLVGKTGGLFFQDHSFPIEKLSIDDLIFLNIALRHSVKNAKTDASFLTVVNNLLTTKIKTIEKVVHLTNAELRLNKKIEDISFMDVQNIETIKVCEELHEYVRNRIEKHILEKKNRGSSPPHFVVMCSGGVDSMTLACIFLQNIFHLNYTCEVVHINWNKRNESAHEASLLKKFFGDKINIYNSDIDKHDADWDDKATNFKYKIFEDIVKNKNETYFILGHIITDVVENLLCNIFTGVSKMNQRSLFDIFGMKEMSVIRGYNIFRPLLLHEKPSKEIFHLPDNAENLDVQRRVFRRMNIPYDVNRITTLYQDNEELRNFINIRNMSAEDLIHTPTFILKETVLNKMSRKSIDNVKKQLTRRVNVNIKIMLNDEYVFVRDLKQILFS